MIESLSKFESCGIPFFRFSTLNFLSSFLDRRSFNFDDFASMESKRDSGQEVTRFPEVGEETKLHKSRIIFFYLAYVLYHPFFTNDVIATS